MNKTSAGFALALAFCLMAPSIRAEEKDDALLQKVQLGEHWYGPEVNLEDLKGHVTLVEFWGYNCGPCVASIPHLVKLQDELRDTGFTIIAGHSQNVPKDTVVGLLRKNHVNYVVTGSVSVPDHPVEGLPAAFLFDASGKLVDQGRPMEMTRKIRDLVKSEPHFLAAGRSYTKLAPIAEALKTTKAYGQVMKRLEKDAKGEGAAAEEAKYLSERITAYGKKNLENAKKLETQNPDGALRSYSDLATNWKGTEVGDQSAARLKELKSDKDFQTELKASQVLGQILADCGKLIISGDKINLESGPNKKIADGVMVNVQGLKKKFPNSKAAARLGEELSPFGFKNI